MSLLSMRNLNCYSLVLLCNIHLHMGGGTVHRSISVIGTITGNQIILVSFYPLRLFKNFKS